MKNGFKKKSRDLNIKAFLKKWGLLYSFARWVYWQFMALRARLFGSLIEERKWSSRNIAQVKRSFVNLNHPHRRFLLDQLQDVEPFSSILEIGAGYGANLYWIGKKYGNAKLTGIDIDTVSISEGASFFLNEKMPNVNLIAGRADIITQIPDKSYDIIITDATLIYLDPNKIMKITKEMFRVARKSLIFCEWHDDSENDSRGVGFYRRGCWVRNYANLCKNYVSREKIKISKIPDYAWPEDNWQEMGCMIKITI